MCKRAMAGTGVMVMTDDGGGRYQTGWTAWMGDQTVRTVDRTVWTGGDGLDSLKDGLGSEKNVRRNRRDGGKMD